MNVEATYHEDDNTILDIKTDTEKQNNADRLISTSNEKEKNIDNFLKDKDNDYFVKNKKELVSDKHDVHIKFKPKDNISEDKVSKLIDKQLTNPNQQNYKNKKSINESSYDLDITENNKTDNLIKNSKTFRAKDIVKKSGMIGLGLLNESEEFRDTDKITDKVSTLKRAKDIADKIKKSRRASKARTTANKIKATEKAIKAQQVAQKASSIKASASGAKAVAGAGSAVGSAASAPVLGVIGVVLLALACIIAFTMLLMTILSNKPNDAGSLTGIEREIAIALMNNGYDKIHVAAIMGNMSAESGFNSKALQDVGDFDNLYGDDRTNEHGYGLNQMTNGRKNNFCGLAEGNGANHSDINSQVQYFCTPVERAESN